jgi:molybdopterin-guanine dinucleotide biosynthesis protein A
MRSLLLAGGRSSRMGTDKAMIEVDGHSMISRIVKALTLAGLEPIRIAVANPEDIEKYGSEVGLDADVEWVLDARTHAGPIDAIEEALLDSGCGEILQLAAVDYPWVTEELFISLQEGLDDDNALIMPHDGEMSHPLLALIRSKDVLGMLHSDRRPLRAQFAEIKHSILIEEPEILRNVNSPEDLG